MALFDRINTLLRGPVGNNRENDPEDIRSVKHKLDSLGYFEEDNENDFITKDLDDAIKTFQRDNGLKIDGYLLPRGETENTIRAQLEKRMRTPGIVPEYSSGQGIILRPERTKPGPFVRSLQDGEDAARESEPTQFDATGRVIRSWDKPEEKTPPKPERKPVIPELSRPTFDLKTAPVVNLEKNRREILLGNKPARFEIQNNPDLNDNSTKEQTINLIIKNDKLAAETVKKHDAAIERLSRKHGADPDMMRAIMWTENARGDKGSLNRLADKLGMSDSQTPMNINGELWSPLIGKKSGPLNNVEENIEAGVILVKRIGERVGNPTPAKIGTIWQFGGREKTNDFGAAVEKVYKQKPWQKRK